MDSKLGKWTCLNCVWVLLLTGILSGNLAAQFTYNFGTANNGANVTATPDNGFLLQYQVTNGRLAYQKYDSNAVFQYGFTQPANSVYTATQRFGKVFALLTTSHEDTMRLQKIDMATGTVLLNRKLGGPQYGTIGYFNYTPYHVVATQDSGLLVVLSKWQSTNAFFSDVSMVKFDKNLNVQYIRYAGWPSSQNILSRQVREHSDGSIWHITTVSLQPGFGLNIVRLDGQTGAILNQVTLNNMGNPSITGFAELPGRVILSGINANNGYAMSITPNLSSVQWMKVYTVPLNYAGAYEFNVGPNNLLYGHLGDKVLCIRPTDGTVVWSVDADGGANVVPRIRLGVRKMLAIYNPGSNLLKGTVMDSLGAGLCNPVNYPVTVTSMVPTPTTYNFFSYPAGVFTHFTLPNPAMNAVTANPTVACSTLCNFNAGFSASTNALTVSFVPQPVGLTGYFWTFGDGGTSNSMAPSHTYAAAGTYTVCMIGTSGCMSDTICQQVTVVCSPSNAAFTTTAAQQTVTFTNTSSGSAPLTYAWAFGDGQTSTQTSPVHVYSAPGYYNACLIVNGPCGADTTCTLINAGCVATVAAFSSTTNLLVAQFSNTSISAGATTAFWNFGDGQTSTQISPSHTYPAAGTYTVCLITNSPCGADTLCQSVTITCPLPVSGFSATTNQLLANFSNSSTDAASSIWDFGDWQTSSQANPSHTYAAAGTYTVCLIVNSTCGADTLCQSVTITCPLPVSGFSATTNQLLANLSNSSTGAASSIWDFGDGQTSSQANPSHTYAAAGTYTVCLIVNSTCGADTLCQPVTITCPLPISGFTATTNQLVANFSNSSTGAASSIWDFGDGQTSSQANPSHTYAAAGTYTVCLIVNSTCGADTLCQSVTVTCPILTAAISSAGSFPLVQFTDLTIGSPSVWQWDFGDGGTSGLQNPQHNYANPGTYTVCLTVQDSCSTDTTCQSVDVLVGVTNGVILTVEVYPNPAFATVWVRWPQDLDAVTLQVMTMDGRQVFQTTTAEGELALNLNGWSAGVYAVAVQAGEQRVVRRLVVQR